MTDAPTEPIPIADGPMQSESPEDHLIGWALALIENADRCFGHQNDPPESLPLEAQEWLDARDKWRAAFHDYLGTQRATAVMAESRMPGGMIYPHESGGCIVIGPECFADAERKVICWQGENYYPSSQQQAPDEDWTAERPDAGRLLIPSGSIESSMELVSGTGSDAEALVSAAMVAARETGRSVSITKRSLGSSFTIDIGGSA